MVWCGKDLSVGNGKRPTGKLSCEKVSSMRGRVGRAWVGFAMGVGFRSLGVVKLAGSCWYLEVVRTAQRPAAEHWLP